MTRFLLLIGMLAVITPNLSAQENPFTDSLKRTLENAKTPAEKIKSLGILSLFYFSADKKLSDEYSRTQFELAEASRDRKLIVAALLWDARRHYNVSSRQENIDIGMASSQKALEIAKSSSLNAEQAWAYIFLANGSRQNGDADKALNYNNLALTIISTLDHEDSLAVWGYNSLGATYLAKNERMLAFRNYLHALNIAENADKYLMLRICNSSLSQFYAELEDYEKAKDYLYKNLQLSLRFKNRWDRLDLYNALGSIYARNKQKDLALEFYEKSIALADTLKFDLVKLNAYGYILELYMSGTDMKKALDYFNSKPELKSFLQKAGFQHVIDQSYGMAYTNIGRYDSAYYYLKKAEPGFENTGNRSSRLWYYNNVATFYKKKGELKNALTYYKKVLQLGEETNNMDEVQTVNRNLDTLYQQLGDFKSAYVYSSRYQHVKDSLDKLSEEKDLMLLEVENENKRKEREALLEVEATRTRHNIQYMGITVAIAGVFILLVMLGTFSVSPSTIRILGFFAFIFLFEFIILLADNQIHDLTHGEPWKVLVIKIGLISILLPFHHFLEEKVIHYLTSRKLLKINRSAIFSRFMPKKNSESSPMES